MSESARPHDEGPSGILVVDKAPGPTSFDIVQRVRRRFQLRRVGHGGTLDPFASGVLPVCLGEATKLAPYLLDADKEYETEVRLGVETDTYDHTGRVLFERAVGPLSRELVEQALEKFRGTFEQLPPAYAAIKVQGRALYDYARKGEEAPRVPRRITVRKLEGLSWDWPLIRIFVRCSKGTYIRSLAHDIGEALGVGGHLTALRRLRSGPFTLERAVPSTRLDRGDDGPLPALISLADALGHWPSRVLPHAAALAIEQGKRVAAMLEGMKQGEFVRLLRDDGSLLAVATAEASLGLSAADAPDHLKPQRVFLDSRAETRVKSPESFTI